MTKLAIAQGEWVVVCDGAKALILENMGDAKFPNLRMREVVEEPHPATSDIGTDAPGTAHSSVGPGRSSVGQTDWHEQAERRFLENLMMRLDAAIEKGEATSLIIVAPPRALGVVRQAYTHNVRQALHTEIDKDFVKMPVFEIEKHLVG